MNEIEFDVCNLRIFIKKKKELRKEKKVNKKRFYRIFEKFFLWVRFDF